MTGTSVWRYIKELAECDRTIFKLNETIENTKHHLEQNQQAVESFQTLYAQQQHRLQNFQKDLHLKELTSKELAEQENRKRMQLEHIKDQKAYMALEREIEVLSKKRAQLEDDSLRELYTFDALKKEFHLEQSQSQEKKQLLIQDIQAKTQSLAELEHALLTLIEKRASLVPLIQPEWYNQYERMKHSVTNPIAPILNACCSACFYSLPHQEMSRAKHGDIMICRSCYRFIYYNTEEEKTAHEARY